MADFNLAALFDESNDDPSTMMEIIHQIEGGNSEMLDAIYAQELQFEEFYFDPEFRQHLNVYPISSSNTNSTKANDTATHAQRGSSEAAAKVSVELVEKDEAEKGNYYCGICFEEKRNEEEIFRIQICRHYFCAECISTYIKGKVDDNRYVILCPSDGCPSVIEPDACKSIVSDEVIIRWEEEQIEDAILESHKYYCPYNDCSVLLVKDDDDDGENVGESECPICWRLFCARCKVPWHAGMECEEFGKLNEDEKGSDDIKVRMIAKDNHWMRCPNCKMVVERTQGCIHMTCRCKFEFCYICGEPWTNEHWKCQERKV